ncbi:RNA pseudouridine synthase, partial [Vibrio sinaloensis]
MHQPEQLFTRFDTPIDGITLPEKFTFPFYYQPHPLCVLAAEQLQTHLTHQTDWQHDFGLTGNQDGIGKMFGVLLVHSPEGELGYFSAFSGKIADQNLLPGFVPPVFDMLAEKSFFRSDLAKITELNEQVKQRQANPELHALQQQLAQYQDDYQQAEQTQRELMIQGRAARKKQRKLAEQTLTGDALKLALDDLARQSVAEKNVLKYLKLEWEEKINQVSIQLNALTEQIDAIKQQRKQRSNQLQNKLFEQYRFYNIRKDEKSLKAIFAPTTSPTPPAGAGECAAPKLLHFAFKHGYT